ncbi:MAG: bifunctional oligoribonuclease/PAP phosphatase NrnA [Bacteroidales bacterium]|nr:bifunctional oligoribonuclease/PAP phosphatase NrnA [Bacteroidales bacterium]MCD8394308.1 bifunctional oligoribonuclease/PAP phosphatase NrnA [Bacteroidales bacterium]
MEPAPPILLEPQKLEALRKLIDGSRKIVITCHLTPDGDAIGSSLGLWHVLKALRKSPRVVTPDMPPKNLADLPGASEILVFSRNEPMVKQTIERADLIICLDFNSLKRIDRVGPIVEASTAPKVLIDHHLDPEHFADVEISKPASSSTCFLLYKVLREMGYGNKVGKEAAECIYAGMMTDTGNFTYNSNDPELYVAIAWLLRRGFDKDKLYQRICNTNSESRLRLNGYAINDKMRVFGDHKCALITLDRDELNRYRYERGDTESLVNVPLSIPGMVYTMFLREEANYVKVSTRSRGEFPVNLMCEQYFNGGGHKNAAGGEFYGTMDQCIARLEEAMPLFDQYLPHNDKDDHPQDEKVE